jgi:hypothetical protein
LKVPLKVRFAPVAILAAALSAASCARSARSEKDDRHEADSAAAGPAAQVQGIAGRFEALGGARLPDPGCETLESDAERDSCEKEFLRQMSYPLQGFAVIHPPAGDSLIIPLDDSGAYRAPLPPGFYTVCVRADALEDVPGLCQDSIEVAPGRFTPYSRPFPMP